MPTIRPTRASAVESDGRVALSGALAGRFFRLRHLLFRTRYSLVTRYSTLGIRRRARPPDATAQPHFWP